MEYICLDIETTGLSPKTDSIIEIAGWHIVDGVPIKKFSELVQPPTYIPSFIERKTGVTNRMVQTARTVEEVLPEFCNFCGNLPIVGYNIGFDYRMLVEKSKYLGYDFSLGETRYGLDVFKLVRKYLPSLGSKKLEDVMNYMGIVVPPIDGRALHCAEYDSYITKLVLDAFIVNGCKDVLFTPLDKKDDKVYGEVFNDEVLPF